MEGCLVLKDCAVLRSDGRIRPGLAIRVEGGAIAEVAPTEQIPIRPGDWEVRCGGRAVGAGWVDCHSHLVNGQLVSCSGEAFLRPARARFELQQRQDARLTAGEVEALAAFAMVRSLRRGVTFVAEHLHCPGEVEPALEVFARTARRMGLRALVSHSTTDADGPDQAYAHAEANAGFVRTHAADPLVRGGLGFHASFTCGDALLDQIARLHRSTGAHLQFHAAESEHDLAETYQRHGTRVVTRLEQHGLLGPRSVAALARAVDRDESDRLHRAGVLIALSPRTDLMSEPGGGGFEAVVGRENRVGLGTCGAGPLCLEAASAAAGLIRLARVGRLLDPDSTLLQMLVAGPAELCSSVFEQPSGTIAAGALADLVVYDWVPPELAEPIPDVVSQLAQAPVAWTVVGGRVVVREGRLLGHDELELGREAARVLSLRARA